MEEEEEDNDDANLLRTGELALESEEEVGEGAAAAVGRDEWTGQSSKVERSEWADGLRRGSFCQRRSVIGVDGRMDSDAKAHSPVFHLTSHSSNYHLPFQLPPPTSKREYTMFFSLKSKSCLMIGACNEGINDDRVDTASETVSCDPSPACRQRSPPPRNTP